MTGQKFVQATLVAWFLDCLVTGQELDDLASKLDSSPLTGVEHEEDLRQEETWLVGFRHFFRHALVNDL